MSTNKFSLTQITDKVASVLFLYKNPKWFSIVAIMILQKMN